MLMTGVAQAQNLTPDMLTPVRDGFMGRSNPLQRTPARSGETLSAADANASDGKPVNPDKPAPSRIGQIPTYGLPAASGAATAGFDSTGRRKKPAKAYPGAKKINPKAPREAVKPPLVPTPVALPPSAGANRTPMPAGASGRAEGLPNRRRLKPELDPYSAVGFYAGSFLTYAAIEASTGYDSNPGRIPGGRGSWLYVLSPELRMVSDWSRHQLIVDLRGSYTGYAQPGQSPSVPLSLNRPDFTGKADGRIDVTRDTQIDVQTRLRVATDNPGSPNVSAGLSNYPIYASFGGSLGVTQRFNRFALSVSGTADRTVYQESRLTDGTSSSNADRNYNQYGGILRGSYEVTPAIKPYVEVQADRRIHDMPADRNGYLRDSNGVSGRAGTTFELGRLITADVSIGYATRMYQDTRLSQMKGLLTAASLIWTATPLTTVTVGATSSVDESILPGVSGVLSRNYTAQVDHSFRRWLIGTLKFGYGTSDYDGLNRFDKRAFASAGVVYKLTRAVQVKGEVRHDWIASNVVGVDTQATTVLVGVRYQP